MGKFEPYSRRELNRLRAEWLRRNIVIVVGVLAGISAILVGTTAVAMVTVAGPLQWYLLGAVHVGVLAAAVHILDTAFLAHDREAIWHVRGAWGEDNTRSELQRAKRRRLIWGWVDSINLQTGDIDHLVVTRHGGLVAVDSKWRSRPDDTVDMAKAANKVKLRAEALTRTLFKREPGARHRAKLNPLRVTSVVVLWGASQHDLPDGACVENVEFVAGRRLLEWLAGLEGESVTRTAATEILQRLKNYRAGAWDGARAASR